MSNTVHHRPSHSLPPAKQWQQTLSNRSSGACHSTHADLSRGRHQRPHRRVWSHGAIHAVRITPRRSR
ncbi:hypothetical protein B0T16DRAFT_402985 [Cercophora newfieldiana]|uniref:Uncharacterized protein n=1 Tax=Cercophora newfieldiana TaxID=92897 RepID=A0AA39YT05_9PEZI|nr:hypothetical protein B0T16DRAFT_402985 [Cercophora newfieldiana]